jgi:hypothetical protein
MVVSKFGHVTIDHNRRLIMRVIDCRHLEHCGTSRGGYHRLKLEVLVSNVFFRFSISAKSVNLIGDSLPNAESNCQVHIITHLF